MVWPPSLRDALEFAMAELPEREQAGASFDTLYMLARKMEAHQPNCTHQGQGSYDSYWDRYQRYPAPAGRVTMLAKEELLLPDSEPLEQGVRESDVIEGLSLKMTQVWGDRSLCLGLSSSGVFLCVMEGEVELPGNRLTAERCKQVT